MIYRFVYTLAEGCEELSRAISINNYICRQIKPVS
jgi:hypothetical protein